MNTKLMLENFIKKTGTCKKCEDLKNIFPSPSNRLFNDQYENVIMFPEDINLLFENPEDNFHIVGSEIKHLKFGDESKFLYDSKLREYLTTTKSECNSPNIENKIKEITEVINYMFYAKHWARVWDSLDGECETALENNDIQTAIIATLDYSTDKIDESDRTKILNELDLTEFNQEYEESTPEERSEDIDYYIKMLQEIVVSKAEEYGGWYPSPYGCF